MALRRKKMFEQQIERLQGAMLTIQTQLNAIEVASFNVDTFRTYQLGAEALRQIHQDINVDKVDDAVDDLREQMDIAEEVSQAISQPIGGTLLDDAELEAELAELEQQSIDEQLLQLQGPPTTLPNTPARAIPAAAGKSRREADEEAELEALRRQMEFA